MRPHSTEQNVGFEEHERESVEVTRGMADPLATLPLAKDATLGEFLSRPVRIYETSWTPTTNVLATIYPWGLFFLNPRVENRINNFKLLRCNLCVKVVINGNSFYYGRLMVNYNPMGDRDTFLKLPDGNFENLIRLSQRQHLMCDPCTSTAGCLELPFLYDKEFFDVTQLDTDTQEIGSLSLSTPVGLRIASETLGTAPVTVSIFAWATNVVTGGLTHTNLNNLTPQASPVNDETGLKLSGIAHTVSTFASKFGSFPYIGSYAKATELAAAAVGNIALVFGFSRPALVEEPMRYEPRPVSSLATCIGQDNSVKLTTDPKQEVTIDPLVWSDPSEDQLSIVDVASTWSILDKFIWTAADHPGDMLFNTLVDPCIYHDPAGLNPQIYPTAVCAVTIPFKYWSGSIRIKLDIVASAYHRGRLAVVYDPHQTPDVFEANTNYMEIIDISDCRRTEFTISNTQPQSLRLHYKPKLSDGAFAGAAGGYSSTTRITENMIATAGDIGNGTLSIFVVNELTSPNATSPVIETIVSVCAADDFRVYDPNEELYNYSCFVPQSSLLEPVSVDIEEVSKFSFGVRGSNDSYPDVYIGERILSIRSLMKRYIAYMTLSQTGEHTNTNLVRFKHAMYPLMYLWGDDTVHQAGSGGINYVGHTYLSYFRTGFAVLRGGIRWKVTPLYAPLLTGMAQASVTRLHDVTFTEMADVVMLNGVNSLPRSGLIANRHTANGEAITVSDVNGTLEFEVPYHSNRKFVVGSSSEETKTAAVLSGFQVTGCDQSLGRYVQLYNAASEDTTLGHFIGFPALTYHAAIPAVPVV